MTVILFASLCDDLTVGVVYDIIGMDAHTPPHTSHGQSLKTLTKKLINRI